MQRVIKSAHLHEEISIAVVCVSIIRIQRNRPLKTLFGFGPVMIDQKLDKGKRHMGARQIRIKLQRAIYRLTRLQYRLRGRTNAKIKQDDMRVGDICVSLGEIRIEGDRLLIKLYASI